MWENILAAGAVFVFIVLLLWWKANSYAKRKQSIEEQIKTGDISPCAGEENCFPTIEQIKASKKLQIIGKSEPDPHYFEIGEEVKYKNTPSYGRHEAYGERFHAVNLNGIQWSVRPEDVIIIE